MEGKKIPKGLLLCGLTLLLCFSLSLRAADTKTKSGMNQGEKLFGQRYALVIGIDDYNNAESVQKVLKEMGFEFIGKEELKRNLKFSDLDKAFRNFFLDGKIKSNSRLFVWYSGNATTINGEGFLLPADAPKIKDDNFLKKAFPIRRFDELSRLTKARNVYIVIDAFLSSPIFEEEAADSHSLSAGSKTLVRQFLCAGDSKQTREDNGLFRKTFIDALTSIEKINENVSYLAADKNKDSYLTASEIGTFVKNKTTTPYYGNLKDFPGGDFVFSFKGKDEDNKEIRPPEMVIVPAGTFLMGAVQGGGYSNEAPVHEVKVESFAVGKHEVTFEEYDFFCAATGREKPDDDGWRRRKRPVTNVSWEDANVYCGWLSEQTGEIYRLPTEAEWEYMARAATNTRYWWGNEIEKNEAACYGCNAEWGWDAERKTAPVGSFNPNPWSIYDTVGNVWEWTCSKYSDTYIGKENECLDDISTGGELVVIRGGSWAEKPKECRAARRKAEYPGNRSQFIGFRVVKEIK